jgi:hypothetical protein
MSLDPASKAQPIHGPGHIHIAHDEIDRLARGKYRNGLRGIGGFDHGVAGFSQVLRDGGTDQNLILDHQNYWLAEVTLCGRRVWARSDHYGQNSATVPWVPQRDCFAKPGPWSEGRAWLLPDPVPPTLSSLQRCSASFPQEVDASNNFLRMIRFFERAIFTKVARLVGRSGGSASQDYINIRVMLTNPTGKTEAIRLAAQPHLRKNNVDLLSGTQYGHDVSGRDALENLVSAVAQIACDDRPDQDVGFHDQNSAWCSAVTALII